MIQDGTFRFTGGFLLSLCLCTLAPAMAAGPDSVKAARHDAEMAGRQSWAALGDRLDQLERSSRGTLHQFRHADLIASKRHSAASSDLARERLAHRLRYLRRLVDLEARKMLALSKAWPLPSGAEGSRPDLRIESLRVLLDAALAPKAAPGESADQSPVARAGAPANDSCATATAIGDGSFAGDTSMAGTDGDATCGSSSASPDIWFKYTAPAAGISVFDTFGSGYDTVLSLHSACPGTTANEIDCNDDAFFAGLTSRLSKPVTLGEEVLVRVSGFLGSSGAVTLNVSPGGSISGTVTEVGTATPLSSVSVNAIAAGGSFAGSDITAGDGTYTIGDLPSGSYSLVTFGADPHVDELFDDVTCPWAAACTLASATPVGVASGDTGGIDFELAPGGSLSGTVTEEGTGTPLVGIVVDLFDAAGDALVGVLTAVDGTYGVGGLPAADYAASTSAAAPHTDKLFDDLVCPGGAFTGGCDPTLGMPVPITVSANTPGIDFALPLGGSFSGTITEDGSGTSLAGLPVGYFDSGGGLLDIVFSRADGSYAVGGLATGSYYAVTFGADPHVDELFDDITCYASDCDETSGAAIAVAAPGNTPGIDFALSLGGSISGTVTEVGSGTPLQGIEVTIFDDDIVLPVIDANTAADGTYSLTGLVPGSYFASTDNSEPHIEELFDDLPCLGGNCNPGTGTPIAVASGLDSVVDFALALGASIGGTVTADGTGTPLGGVFVEIRDSGETSQGVASTAGDGTYTIAGVPTGTYRARTFSAFADERFDDLSCVGTCDLPPATPIAVVEPVHTGGVDFALFMPGEEPDLVLQHEEKNLDADFCATQTLTLGPGFAVGGTADVSFTAGQSVIFVAPVSVGTGASIEAGVQQPLVCP